MKTQIILLFATIRLLITQSLPFEHNKFTNNPGIYFENISPLHISVSQWNLITFYNISNYEQKHKTITTYFDNLKDLCTKYESKYAQLTETCIDLMKINIQTLKKITEEREILQQYLTIDDTDVNTINKRKRRSSFFGGIGKLQRALFGVLTEEEGENYERKIRTLEEKQIKSLLIQREQIKIFKNTLDSVENITSNYAIIRDNVEYNIKKLNDELKLQKDDLKILNIIESILFFNSLYTEILNQYSKETTLLLNIIMNAHNGLINPQVLKPSELLTQLKDIKTNLPTNLNLPVEISTKNYFDFIKIIDLKIFYNNHLLVYVIHIPLIENIPFTLYRIINLPVHVKDNDFIFIQSTHEFLAVENNKQLYTFFNQNQIDKCKTIKQKLICQTNIPLSNNVKPNCEFQLFTNGNIMPKNCEIKTVPIFNDIWHQLGNNNRWLYATHETIDLIINCQDDVNNIRINGTGILTLKPNCKAFTKNNIILAKYLGKGNFSKDYVPQFQLPTGKFNTIIKNQKENNANHHNSATKFNDLNIYAKSMTALDEQLKNELTNEYKEKVTTVHTTALSALLMILLGITIFKISKYMRKRNKNKISETVQVIHNTESNSLQVQENIQDKI